MEKDQSSDLRGVWILGVFTSIYMVGLYLWADGYIHSALKVPDNYSFGDGPPFELLRDDFVKGVMHLMVIIATLVLCTLTWNKYRMWSVMALWQSWIRNVPQIAVAALIYIRCTHLLDAEKAQSAWATREAYRADSMVWGVRWGTMAIVMVFTFFLIYANRPKGDSLSRRWGDAWGKTEAT